MTVKILQSSAIQQVEYDAKKKDLDVLFTDGIFESYHGVPVEVYQGLITAESAGYYFNKHIRGKYAFS